MKPDSNSNSANDSGTCEYSLEDISEVEWLNAAMRSESFKFLADPSEDIYTLKDGMLFSEADS